MRISDGRRSWSLWLAALAGVLTSCGPAAQPAATQAIPEAEADPKLPCARGHAALAPQCTLTRERTAKGEIWTIRHPDGGFRRLLVEGNEVSAADGAEPLRSDGDDVVIGDERYRLPDE